ncbi:MAG TPA: DUF3307 domain-containing protein [Chloroflexota bacterium]|nr:DUF3307 domain-containing protein [Chloroflexota bacterium]HUM68366.1 DUF3307 domain-containing protein [Chloroflexota bacterium]
MTIFATLLLAHLLADFPLQTNRIFRMKIQGAKGLTLHVLIHVLVTALLIRNFWQVWTTLLILGVLHYLTDWAKLRYANDPLTPGFVLDQAVHIITLIVITVLTPQIMPVFPLWFLIPAIVLATIPALLTFGYVWASDQCRANMPRPLVSTTTIQWACDQLLPLSQKTGWVIVAVLIGAGLLVVA